MFSVYIDGKCREVIVHCDGGGDIGIALVGGRGHGLFIWSIEAGSPAARSKLLHPNDEIVEVASVCVTYVCPSVCLSVCLSVHLSVSCLLSIPHRLMERI